MICLAIARNGGKVTHAIDNVSVEGGLFWSFGSCFAWEGANQLPGGTKSVPGGTGGMGKLSRLSLK